MRWKLFCCDDEEEENDLCTKQENEQPLINKGSRIITTENAEASGPKEIQRVEIETKETMAERWKQVNFIEEQLMTYGIAKSDIILVLNSLIDGPDNAFGVILTEESREKYPLLPESFYTQTGERLPVLYEYSSDLVYSSSNLSELSE